MKNLSKLLPFVLLALFVVLACKNNPLSKFTKQYNCTIAGEPEPKTSDEFVERARKHAQMYSGDELANNFDDCAIAALDEAIRLDPNNARALVLHGMAMRQKLDADAALKDFDKAIAVDPNNADAYHYRGRLNLEKDRLDKAMEDLTKAIELTPKDRQELGYIYSDRGEGYSRKRDYEKAVKDFSEAIRLKPDAKFLYAQRAEAYRELGKNDLADADSFEALKLEDDKKIETPGVLQNSNSVKSTAVKTISGGVLNGKAIDLPEPTYPASAKAVRASGAVNVQVMVDENGRVISASAVSGHPLLRAAAVEAARKAKFSPTLLSGKPVKVTGVIVYNFVPE